MNFLRFSDLPTLFEMAALLNSQDAANHVEEISK